MRYIEIIEGITHNATTYWFNPATKEVIPCGDHGQAVQENPEQFGIDWNVVQQMEDAWPDGSEDDEDGDFETEEDRDAFIDDLPPPPAECGSRQGNDRNNCWEQLGMNRGWVRVGHSVGYLNGTAAYFSSSTPKAIWHGVRYAQSVGGVGDKGVDIELCPVGGQGSQFTSLAGEALEHYLKFGLRMPFPQ